MSRITYIKLNEDVRQFPNTEAVFSGSTSFIQGIKVKNIEIDPTLNPTYGDGLYFDGIKFISSPMTSYQDEIINGMNVTVDEDNALILNIAPGAFKLKGVNYAFTGQSVTLNSGDTINPRFDIIYVNSASTINILQGTPSPSPVLPTFSANTFLEVSIIFVTAGYFSGSTGTTIVNNNQNTVIGVAEDGDYTDGLFTDFTPNTAIGVPIDRFNEVLKALAPSPAPNLYEFNTPTIGSSARLSFGVSNPIVDYYNVTGITSLTPVDFNENFTISTYRKGVFRNTPSTITFNLNDIVVQTSGYSGKSFNDGDLGVLNLYLNNSLINTLNLIPTGSTSSDMSNSIISVTPVTSVKTNTGADFNLFKYRTGTITLNKNGWQNGYNYCKVEHVINGTIRSTNFIDFIHDHTSGVDNNLNVTNVSLTRTSLLGERYLSGVKYNTGATFTYDCTIGNYYKNVYPASNVNNAFSFNFSTTAITSTINSSIVLSGTGLTSSITGTNTTQISAQTLTTGSTAHDTNIRLIGNYRTNPNSTLLGSSNSLTIGISTNHPIKTNLSNDNQRSLNNFLIFNPSLVNTNSTEYFSDESYRLINRDYDDTGVTYSTINTGSTFNSQLSIINGTNQENNLLCYNNRLYYPANNTLPNNGNFSNSNLSNSEFSGNPNYSSQTNECVYYRMFKKTDTIGSTNFTFRINAVNTTASTNNIISGNTVSLEIIIIKTNGNRTSVLNLAKSVDGLLGDFSFNTNLNFSLGTLLTMNQNDILVFKVTSTKDWNGYISEINFNL